MKLWIIYKDGYLIAKVIAEMIQDRLENYIDVSVGKASKIDPSFIIEDELNYLIIGDFISEKIPSVEIQKWALEYQQNNKTSNLSFKALSGFIITQNKVERETQWTAFVQGNIQSKAIYPPILLLKLNKSDLVFETGIHELVKEYSNKLIEFIINKPENDTKEKFQRSRENKGK